MSQGDLGSKCETNCFLAFIWRTKCKYGLICQTIGPNSGYCGLDYGYDCQSDSACANTLFCQADGKCGCNVLESSLSAINREPNEQKINF